ncbi:MAG: hypothetical protein JO235_16050 [Chroococcidiopsidaceae cyanobacterium CP_BM_RX_35]|nr:hypothetical protein [Chroococcidiopsidaceae cyanobacterium CP_BM_RX_35]
MAETLMFLLQASIPDAAKILAISLAVITAVQLLDRICQIDCVKGKS